ncbi:helix-turn-helix transcriptional regulator [Zobellella maritima]|uniref:helix-turn-helix transcriptional regulator n=1 Tax=Zobellella maritima TaxID=2059725 RepID=UPI000E300B45|nr:PAS domain-containing protein [Zobellella maritima]
MPDESGAALLTEQFKRKKQFNQQDRQLLAAYAHMVDGLADMFGRHCEIVLHTLEDLDDSVIKVANGAGNGRTSGAPLTEQVLAILPQLEQQQLSHSPAYFTQGRLGGPMKSSTLAVRNLEGEVIGLLCINLDLAAPFHEFMADFLPKPVEAPDNSLDNFSNNVEELVTLTVERTIDEINADPDVANNAKNKQIVISLFEKGIFDIKDAIAMVSDKLNISKHTVYLYIRQKKRDEDDIA